MNDNQENPNVIYDVKFLAMRAVENVGKYKSTASSKEDAALEFSEWLEESFGPEGFKLVMFEPAADQNDFPKVPEGTSLEELNPPSNSIN